MTSALLNSAPPAPPPPAPHLLLEGIVVRHGPTLAVDGVDLALARGEVGALLGPSGCGKTSLLRAVAGLAPPQAGRVRLGDAWLCDGHTHVAPQARRIGMVFQDYALFPHLTVAQNIGFGLRDVGEAERAARVQEMLDLVGLPALGQRMPHELSGGQQQRIALARALAPRPQLLLLDEPFSSLDVDLRERLAQDVRRILNAKGITALLVTHDRGEAFALADRVGVMRAGRLEQWSDPYTLYHEPATRFVATFVGHGVFVGGEVVACGEHGACIRTPLGEWVEPAPGAVVGQRREVLLRADDLIHDDSAATQARIERIAFRGAQCLYELRLPSGERVLALVPSHHEHHVGDTIAIRPDVAHVVSFA